LRAKAGVVSRKYRGGYMALAKYLETHLPRRYFKSRSKSRQP
jgi:hypothetical protein